MTIPADTLVGVRAEISNSRAEPHFDVEAYQSRIEQDILRGKFPVEGYFYRRLCKQMYGKLSKRSYRTLFASLHQRGFVYPQQLPKGERGYRISCQPQHWHLHACTGFQYEAEVVSNFVLTEEKLAVLVRLNDELYELLNMRDEVAQCQFGLVDYEFHERLVQMSQCSGYESFVKYRRGAMLVCPGPLRWTQKMRIEIVKAHDRLIEALKYRSRAHAYTALACDYRVLGEEFLSEATFEILCEATS